MQGHPEIIELLNDVLTAELTAINQYFVHAKMADNWGFERLADKIRHESIDEMHHAEKLIDRILYLEGMPNLQRLGALRVGETMPEALRLDLSLEHEAIIRFNSGIAKATEHADNGTRELLEELLVSEESHTDWLETQVDLLNTLGEQHYLAQQIRD